ncbi:SNW/SKI-interacting protein-like, partial [Trifolium medium]|nr:SNW/SKI-interacting protein-like [Trifolium medium]
RKVEDFGEGGAFPEIHVAQYPLDMGRNKSSILPVTVDAHGKVAYDAIVKQNENAKKIVYTHHKDLIPKILRNDEDGEMDDVD